MEPGGAGYEALALPSELFKWILIALYIDVTKLLTPPPTCVTSLANTLKCNQIECYVHWGSE